MPGVVLSFNSYSGPLNWFYYYPYFKNKDWDPERLSSLSSVTLLTVAQLRFEPDSLIPEHIPACKLLKGQGHIFHQIYFPILPRTALRIEGCWDDWQIEFNKGVHRPPLEDFSTHTLPSRTAADNHTLHALHNSRGHPSQRPQWERAC